MKKLLSLLTASVMAGSAYADETAPGTRWWWLGSALDTANVRWNMEQYASHGIGAVEITPLYGVKGNDKNNIEYLSPKWMEMLKYVQQQGKRLGIQVDMNNGTGWPFGGPTTPVEEAACKVVVVDSVVDNKTLKKGYALVLPPKEVKTSKLAFVMAFPKEVKKYKGEAIEVTQYVDEAGKLTWKAPSKGTWRIIAIYNGRTRQQVKRAAPGGQGYVIDHFDKTAVKHYLERFDKAFAESGTPWPHSMFNDSYEVYGADWTPTLPEEFAKRRGYSLKQNIDKLVDRDAKMVSDYRETLSDMLLENFTNQWASWAHSHGMTVRNQAHGSPANLIDVYAAVDIPEIEGFGLSEFGIKGLRVDAGMTKLNDSDYSMLKYAPSAAHITGKKLVSSETFTWLTEHFRTSLAQMKPDLDLMFCAGVNHMFFHGSCYSPKNDPWPGWRFYASVDMTPNNSIWRDAPELMTYIQRCQSFLQAGKSDNDILVYFPVRDLWLKNSNKLLMQFAIHNLGHLAPEFKNSILELDRLGYDCDYVSDKYLLSAKVMDGKIVTEGGTPYKALLIPEGSTLTDAVKAQIEALKAQGIAVIYGNDKAALAKVAKPEEMKTRFGLKMIRRTEGGAHGYFIANLTPNDVDEYVQLAVEAKNPVWYNPLTDQWFAAETSEKGVKVTLRSGESMILHTDKQIADKETLPVIVNTAKAGTEIALEKGWKLSFTEEAPKVEGVFNIDTLRTWETLDNDSAKVTMGTGVYETSFTIASSKPQAKKKVSKRRSKAKAEAAKPMTGRWAIDLGDVRESARVYINGTYVGCAWSVPYVLNFDGSVLREGANDIKIEVTNLPANRIADLDRRGVEWRKFEEINVVDIKYKKTKYDQWSPMPSGLNSSVKIYQLDVK